MCVSSPADLTLSQLLVLSCAAVVPSLLLLLPALHGCVVGLGHLLAADVLQPLGQGLGLTHTGAHLHLPYIVRREAAIILPAVTGAYAAGGHWWLGCRGCSGRCSEGVVVGWSGPGQNGFDTRYQCCIFSFGSFWTAVAPYQPRVALMSLFATPRCAAWVLSRQFDVKVPQVVAIREAWSSSDRWGRAGGGAGDCMWGADPCRGVSALQYCSHGLWRA